jgi:hypothetical protein
MSYQDVFESHPMPDQKDLLPIAFFKLALHLQLQTRSRTADHEEKPVRILLCLQIDGVKGLI